MYPKTTIVLLLLFISLKSFGQNENIFLDRAYWKTNPTINNINQKIMEGHDITALNSFAFDPICYALLEKVDNNIIKYLLTKKGNEVNKMTHDGRTYIFWAAYKNNLEMMKYLKNIGANMNIVDNHGYSLLNFAATTGQLNTELYDFCIENGSDPSKEKNHSGANALLLVTPHIKDISLINYFTSKGIDMKTTDNNGNGIFNYAAKAGNIPLMKYLLKQGISYKKLNKQGENAMILASRGIRNKPNSLKSFQYLESLGISPNIISKNGITPLHAISYRGKDIEIFEYFLSKGVDINQADDKGNTPFMNAAYMNEVIIVSFLSDHVTNVNHQNKKGMTALSNAIQRNSIEVIKFLLEIGADVHVKDKKGNTLSYYLIKSLRDKNLDTFKQKVAILSQKGFDVTQYQQDGNSLFHLAVETNNTDLVQWVHSYNLNINTKNNNGLTPLQKVVMSAKDDKMILLLVSLGADKTIKTDFGESTYDLAMENELLRKNNINIEFLK
jgi:ankyrin repeat protein